MSDPAIETVRGPSSPARQGWWRGNRWWLAGALVSGVLAFWLPYREAVHEFVRTREPSVPIDVPAGAWGEYAGARWRVAGVQREDGLLPSVAGYAHSDSSLVVVTYEVIAGRGVTGDALDRCRGRLSDVRGRRWDAGAIPRANLSPARQQLNVTCGSRPGAGFEREQARPGFPFVFHHLYQVPRDARTADLRGEIAFPAFMVEPQGAFLRFDLGRAPPP